MIDRIPDDSDAAEETPPADPTAIVYVPSERVHGQVSPDTQVELRYLADGTLTLPVFTSPDSLVAACGPEQPWIGVPAEHVEEFRQLVGAELAVVDPDLAESDGGTKA